MSGRTVLSRWGPVALPLLATALAYLLYGAWGLAGGLAGALAAFAAAGAGGGRWVRGISASLPPLVAVGPAALLVAAVLALVLVERRLADPRVYLFGGLALFVPLPGAPFVATAAGALLLATGPRAWAAGGAALALGSWVLVPGASPAPGLLAVVVGLLARGLASHPANATVARGLVALGALLLCVPALGAVGLAAAGVLSLDFALIVGLAAGALLLGALLLACHAGLAALHLSDLREPALWTTLTWTPLLGILLLDPAQAAIGPPLTALLPLLGLMAVTTGVGFRWMLHPVSRQEVAGKA